MGEVYPMPTVGDVFSDVRGGGRTMRVSYHENRQVVVISLWADALCRGSFQLPADEVGRLADLLSRIEPPAGAVPQPEPAGLPAPSPSPDQTGDVSRSALPAIGIPRVA
ncbi:hypothetical protein [Actinoplanes utahensis]|uniref:Uncharacterized protein n=1 Tax=Actinoplanes utahensis TaxID=1869 RepID=A0A0A6UHN7_ACTUT|nr:hypothetical protein [Actinoplanes utahensis]KHD75575.1 hypothetical protein MB27_22475 [Actinoplanes utahensis]GIF32391.1 hypothetical protein Aut01nite_53770 [Actinoplanes utahensis]